MRTIVHIGTEKTGSTSIQRFLRTNRRVLRKHGLMTSRSLGPRSQVALAVASLADDRTTRLHRRLGLLRPDEVRAYRASRRAALARDVGGAEGTLLLSCEQLSALPRNEQDVDRLISWLGDLADDIAVVVYLRRQDLFLVSLYSQSLKLGRTQPLSIPSEASGGPGSKYDYWALVSRWAAVVGAENVKVRIFEPAALVQGDVVRDYMGVVGLADDPALDLPERRNPSLDAEGAEFLRLFNQHVPAKTDGPDALRGDVSPAVTLASHTGPALALDPDDARSFVSRFEPGNAAIAEHYLGRPGTPLFSQEYASLSGAPTRLSVERAVQISARIWTHKQEQYMDAIRRLEASSKVGDGLSGSRG